MIIRPVGPTNDTEIVLRYERQRRREEGWEASNRGDDKEIEATDSSGPFPPLLGLGLFAAIVLILARS